MSETHTKTRTMASSGVPDGAPPSSSPTGRPGRLMPAPDRFSPQRKACFPSPSVTGDA
ncbi:MAG: hypothetical protein LBT40_16140 [Deltaproteobacteria bacterium]|nr:hypothetical protein [Deltaproteobacteria bacterium]